MRRILIAMLFLLACNTQPKESSKTAMDEIIQADKTMSDMAAKEGFHKALLFYADDSVVKPNEGVLPIIGKTTLQNKWSAIPDNSSITWQPFKAEASGDLGYTIGNWKYQTKDTTMYGNYCTIWKKQPDGKWKFVFDGGNNTPKP
jgi:ketosteroid isomerase-like protein